MQEIHCPLGFGAAQFFGGDREIACDGGDVVDDLVEFFVLGRLFEQDEGLVHVGDEIVHLIERVGDGTFVLFDELKDFAGEAITLRD